MLLDRVSWALIKPTQNPPEVEETLEETLRGRGEGHSPFNLANQVLGAKPPAKQDPPNTTLLTNSNKRKTKTFDHVSPTLPGEKD